MATGSIECQICPNSFQTPESYRINISSVKVLRLFYIQLLNCGCAFGVQTFCHIHFQQAILTASDPPALWYAVNSLLQILRLFHGSGIPQVQVRVL